MQKIYTVSKKYEQNDKILGSTHSLMILFNQCLDWINDYSNTAKTNNNTENWVEVNTFNMTTYLEVILKLFKLEDEGKTEINLAVIEHFISLLQHHDDCTELDCNNHLHFNLGLIKMIDGKL